MTNYIGWQTIDYAATIKAGSSGQQQATMRVDAGGSPPAPISSYDDWSCQINFTSPFNSRTAITMSPEVTGNAEAMTLTITLAFTPEMTEGLLPGVYVGDIIMTSVSQGRYMPLSSYELTIERTN